MSASESDTILVRVNFVIPVSRSAWESNYGVTGTAAIKRDVKTYIENGVIQQFDENGVTP